MKKIITILIILAIVGAGLFSYFKFFKSDKQNTEDKSKTLAAPVPVEVAKSIKGDLPLYISSSGKLEAKKINDYTAEVSGNISLNVREGESVKKGELLFEIDNTDYKVAYQQALLEYKKSYIEYVAISEDINSEDLKVKIDKKNLFSSDNEIEKIQKNILEEIKSKDITENRIQYRLGEKEMALKKALADYRKCKIRAPFSGVVGNIDISEGEYVKPNDKIMTLADISTLRIKAKIISKDLNKLKENSPAVVFPIINDKEYEGYIYSINPIISQNNSTYAVVEINNQNRELKPGMFCDVKLQYDLLKDRVLVPQEAVLEREEQKLVFVIRERNDEKLAYWNYVDIGAQNYEYIEIEDKLEAGKTVIVKGHYTISHKSAVTINENTDKNKSKK
ncbi:MAG: efflux RND transporter periplasmic adaptor subunit [Candidatus Mcinerneyibacterium aminivorans]|uniref:Efflux RND transporter periplasmic adaptor subunit n=1 Tax=Candidatus Mcinerneyibacterium aminivorans TaxID=2703815 RepID=A0A5D0MII2_9BACT|nr:MAG: efflux RND transporter periplasmic adaptor subunit [Candidatus Mcinerneyibacterium aminivorans]